MRNVRVIDMPRLVPALGDAYEMGRRSRNLVGAFASREPPDRTLFAISERGMTDGAAAIFGS
jgi:hypothetical protein